MLHHGGAEVAKSSWSLGGWWLVRARGRSRLSARRPLCTRRPLSAGRPRGAGCPRGGGALPLVQGVGAELVGLGGYRRRTPRGCGASSRIGTDRDDPGASASIKGFAGVGSVPAGAGRGLGGGADGGRGGNWAVGSDRQMWLRGANQFAPSKGCAGEGISTPGGGGGLAPDNASRRGGAGFGGIISVVAAATGIIVRLSLLGCSKIMIHLVPNHVRLYQLLIRPGRKTTEGYGETDWKKEVRKTSKRTNKETKR